MACQYTNLADVEQFRKDVQHKDFISTSLLLEEIQLAYDIEDNLIPLQRGGHIIKTSIGPIQYGLPPETVKDSLNLGLEVPTYYIIPFHRFNKKFGISVAEFEFPAYFNFFVKHKQVILICTKEAEASIRIVFQETLLGPLDHKNLFQDFHPNNPKEAYPNFHKELSIFSKNPTNPDEPLQIDTLLKFIIYEENNFLQINELVQIDNG
ncbi:hypothetical protein pb186bvf_015249 [Paramecium bursaria]